MKVDKMNKKGNTKSPRKNINDILEAFQERKEI